MQQTHILFKLDKTLGNLVKIIFTLFILSGPALAAAQESTDNKNSQEDFSKIASDDNNSSDYQLLSDFEERIESLEEEMKSLRGSIEQLEQKLDNSLKNNNKSIDSINKRLKDFEAKLEQASKENKNNSNAQKNTNNTRESQKEKLARVQKEYNQALAQLKEKNYEKSEELFKQFISNYQGDPLLSNAYFWYAEGFFRRDNYEKAAIYFLKGYNLFPKGAKASDSLLKLAESLHLLGKNDQACKMLSKLGEEFPERSNATKNRAKELSNKIGCKSAKKAK